MGGEGVQQALLRILEGTTIQIANKAGANAGASAAGTATAASKVPKSYPRQAATGDVNGVETAGGLGPWYNHRRAQADSADAKWNSNSLSSSQTQAASLSVDTSSILFVLSGAFVGIDHVIRNRLDRLSGDPTTLNVSSEDQNEKPHAATLSQCDLLSRLEPSDLEQYGMIPEFIGRVPVSVVLNPLSHQDLIRVMTEPRNSLVDQYTSLFKLNGIELHISRGAIEEVVHRAMGTCSAANSKALVRNSADRGGGGGGARSLRRIMEDVLLDAFYESYGSSSVKYILVDRQSVRDTSEVKLFSRGQKLDFEARVKTEAQDWCTRQQQQKQTRHQGANPAKAIRKDGGALGDMDAARTAMARHKARALIRSRLRRTNRLVDPVIYV